MSIECNVITILEEPVVRKINFRLPRTQGSPEVPVYGNGYRIIARGIRNRNISIDYNIRAERAGAGIYDSQKQWIKLPTTNPSQSIPHKALVIHEATHALLDYHRIPLRKSISEAAAYIAQAMYLKLKNAFDQLQFGNDPHFMDIMALAYQISDRILTTPGTYYVTSEELQTLREAIRQAPIYREDLVVPYDGIASRGLSPRPNCSPPNGE